MQVLSRDSNGTRLVEQFGLERLPVPCTIDVPGTLPTIGIEIEVPWHVELPEPAADLMRGRSYFGLSYDEQKLLDNEFDTLDVTRKPAFIQSIEAGYPNRRDAFWEFALDPSLYYGVLQDEVSALYQCELLRRDLTASDVYPLHITVSHLHNNWREVGIMAVVLELMGATTGDRIAFPTTSATTSWAHKGANTGGTKLRTAPSMMYCSMGTEFRTLAFDNEATVLESIRLAQVLGRLMVLHRKSNGYSDEYAEIIAACVEITEPHSVEFMQKWQSPKKAPKLWQNYGAMINSIQNTPELATFRSRILDVVLQVEQSATPNKLLNLSSFSTK